MSTKLFTFHKILSACEEGSRPGWQAFLSDYTPIVFQLFNLYLPSCRQRQEDFWREALAVLSANNFERLQKLEHQAEREFLIDLRAFLLDFGAARLDPGQDSRDAAPPTPESLKALLKGLPLVHQEVLFLKLAGYSDASLEKALVVTPGVARQGFERLRKDYSILLGREEDRSLWPAAWAEVRRFAGAARAESCPSLRQFIRIHEGGSSWYEKEPAEQHVSGCLYCLERWTALREIKYWRREAKPRPLAEVESLLASLPPQIARVPRKSFLARLFG
jgi:hypothetical protein